MPNSISSIEYKINCSNMSSRLGEDFSMIKDYDTFQEKESNSSVEVHLILLIIKYSNLNIHITK